MNQDERYLIAIDLDDTVVSTLFTMNTDSAWALRDAQKAGHLVMIATARPWCITMPYYRALGLDTLVAVMNGSNDRHTVFLDKFTERFGNIRKCAAR